MRYSETDLQCEDLLWFGVDSGGKLFACFSGGIGCVPEFVCRSRKESEILTEFFTETLQAFTHGRCIPQNSGAPVEDCLSLSSKGLYCFDVDMSETHGDFYRIVSRPDEELFLSDLPSHIRDILADHTVDADVSKSNQLTVAHAY